MKLEFDVKVDAGMLYDFLLRHTYTSAQGLIGTCVGALFIVGFAMQPDRYAALVVGLIILIYLPISLSLKAKAQALNPVFRRPIHYTMTEEGVMVSQETEETEETSAMYKAVSTKNSIILYTTRVNACIFPRKQLGGHTTDVIKMIATHMPPKKVKIRY